MTPAEITKALHTDIDKLHSTFNRLCEEYDKERRRLNIDRSRVYTRYYQVKTAAKNPWIIFLSKSFSKEKYNGPVDVHVCAVTYFYEPKGLKLFKLQLQDRIEVYQGHVFTRYRERLKLDIADPIPTIIRFFTENRFVEYATVNKDNEQLLLGVCKEGILLGIMQEQGSWMFNRTFISRDLFFAEQDYVESGLIKMLDKEIKDLAKWGYHKFSACTADALKAIAGNYRD